MSAKIEKWIAGYRQNVGNGKNGDPNRAEAYMNKRRLSALAPSIADEVDGHTITPENFLGIEINPRAAAIAQLVLWIGYLQWHFRVNGEGRMPPDPVLRDVKTIENRDALIDWDKKVLVRDDHGKPLTRWDGETMKDHPVTGKKVPDEAAQVEVYQYIKPRAAKWPKADFIVGNPPFIGGKDVRERLGDGYFEALFKTTDVPESADFVMHWWDKAALAVRKNATRRFGFVTTNSITQVFSRRVIAKHLEAKDRLSLLFAIPNHPWVDEKDGAAVRIAMTVVAKGRQSSLTASGGSASRVARNAQACLRGCSSIRMTSHWLPPMRSSKVGGIAITSAGHCSMVVTPKPMTACAFRRGISKR